jgi:dihydrofolate synthase / folylpolyglutamate synthase
MKPQSIPPLISRAQQYGSILGLDTIKALLLEMGNPEKKLKIIHIAGTNGKGSIASFCQGILVENNYNTGLFTSPYFRDPREMIRYNRGLISQKDFEKTLETVEKAVNNMLQKGKPHPTEFEIYVAAAFYYFTQVPTDFLILEVGLGGREDATNAIEKPVLSIITQIGLDHIGFLGNSLKEIAYHKGGIIKEKTPVIVFPQELEAFEVLQNIAAELNSPLYSFEPNQLMLHRSSLQQQSFSVDFTDSSVSPPLNQSSPNFLKEAAYPEVTIQLPGRHQVFNAATALLAMGVLETLDSLEFTVEKTLQGLYTTKWPGRLEIIGKSPLTIIDGAHNVAAAKSLKETIQTLCSRFSITLLLGMLEDKDVEGFLAEIIPLSDRVILTRPNSPRALNPLKLKEKLAGYPVQIFVEPSISSASLKALAVTGTSDMILAVGSLYMIGEARETFIQHFKTLG